MPTVYNVSAAAAIVGCSPSTLRNWLKTFAPYLSPTATPAAGTERILTPADVATLQFVKAQRDAMKDYDTIIAELAVMPVDDAIEPYIDVQPATTAPEPLQAPTVPLELVQAIQALADDRYNALRQRVEQMESRQGDRLQWFAMGLLAGLLLAIVGIIAVWLGLVAR